MALTSEEQADCRYFLGRTDGNRINPLNSWEELNSAYSLLSVEGEILVRQLLVKLNALDQQLSDILGCIIVESVDTAKLRSPAEVMNALRAEGRRLVKQLARVLGVSVYTCPFGDFGYGRPTFRG